MNNALRRLGIKRGDILVLAALLIVSAALGIFLATNRTEPQYVSVKADGKEIARFPLSKDCVYRINDGNTIEIRDGSVRMSEADCPDKICVKTGRISRSGQSIVCAPHRVTVTITKKKKKKPYDVITN